jgi:hypothetical protein
MFTTPCFIRKNTPEIRKKLEELGYKKNTTYLEHEHNLYAGGGTYASANFIDKHYFDCGTNEELFIALAALRGDIYKNQYCIDSEGNWFLFNKTYVRLLSKTNVNWHKATVAEIIEHFKD